MAEDPYFKKIIPFRQSGAELSFRVSQDLFSSYDVDAGTRLLLRTLAERDSHTFRKILDLGCGYGPIGLTLQKLNEGAIVHMVDRDALAVEYSRRNAELNGASGVEGYGSLGYDDVRSADFDLIVSNIPAKAGEEAISYFLREAAHYLASGGLVAVVVVSRLERFVQGLLNGLPSVEVLLRRSRSSHAVFHYTFSGQGRETVPMVESGLERGVYRRGTSSELPGTEKVTLETVYNLPEFESPSNATEMLIGSVQRVREPKVERAIAFNPGQGYVPLALWSACGPASIELIDRDLLSLRQSRRNLIRNGCPAERITLAHQVGMASESGDRAELIAGVLREDEGPTAVLATVEQASERLAPEGTILVSGSSTAVSRLAGKLRTRKRLRIEDRLRRKGCSLLVLRARG